MPRSLRSSSQCNRPNRPLLRLQRSLVSLPRKLHSNRSSLSRPLRLNRPRRSHSLALLLRRLKPSNLSPPPRHLCSSSPSSKPVRVLKRSRSSLSLAPPLSKLLLNPSSSLSSKPLLDLSRLKRSRSLVQRHSKLKRSHSQLQHLSKLKRSPLRPSPSPPLRHLLRHCPVYRLLHQASRLPLLVSRLLPPASRQLLLRLSLDSPLSRLQHLISRLSRPLHPVSRLPHLASKLSHRPHPACRPCHRSLLQRLRLKCSLLRRSPVLHLASNLSPSPRRLHSRACPPQLLQLTSSLSLLQLKGLPASNPSLPRHHLWHSPACLRSRQRRHQRSQSQSLSHSRPSPPCLLERKQHQSKSLLWPRLVDYLPPLLRPLP